MQEGEVATKVELYFAQDTIDTLTMAYWDAKRNMQGEEEKNAVIAVIEAIFDEVRKQDYEVRDTSMRNMSDLDKDCLMTMEEWLDGVHSNCFTDYDGYGAYSDGSQVNHNWAVKPSDVVLGIVDYKSTHVCWYNK